MKNFTEFTEIHEMDARKKDMLGKGSYHRVYPLGKDSAIKVKKGNSLNRVDDPREWFNIFMKHPEIFARIDKVTKKYVIMEKLDTGRAENEVSAMKSDLLKNVPWLDEHFERNEHGESGHVSELLYTYIVENHDADVALILKRCDHVDVFKRWISYLTKLALSRVRAFVDVNDGNFGYDRNGTLKMLDI